MAGDSAYAATEAHYWSQAMCRTRPKWQKYEMNKWRQSMQSFGPNEIIVCRRMIYWPAFIGFRVFDVSIFAQ